MERTRDLFHNHELSSTRHTANLLIKELATKHMTITAAEGISGGSFLDTLTIPNSTKVFHLGIVAYSRRSKIEDLGVSQTTIDTYGEYSPETALAMAFGIQKFRQDTLAFGVTGNIDPTSQIPIPYAHLVLAYQGETVLKTTINLRTSTRRARKLELAQIMLSHALMFIQKHHHLENYTHQINSNQHYLSVPKINLRLYTLVEYLKTHGLTVSTMESCTGGAIANAITDIPGASSIFDSARVAYDEKAKQLLGDIPISAFAYGKVYSEQVALLEAYAAQEKSGSDIAIGTTGTMENPDTRPFRTDTLEGTVYIAVVIKNKSPFVGKFNLPLSTREYMKTQIVDIALEILYSKLGVNKFTLFKSNSPELLLR